MQARVPKAPQLAAFWFGLQAVWGALLGISLQARSIELHPAGALVAYGQLAVCGALVAAAVQLLAGPYSDRLRARGFDRRAFFVTGTAIGSVGILAFYLAPNFGWLVASLLLLQIGLNVAIGPYQAIIPDYFTPGMAGRASAWMAAFQSIGNAVGAVAAAFAPKLGMPPWQTGAILLVLLVAGCMLTVAHARTLQPRAVLAPARFRFTRASADLFVSRALLWVGFYTMLGYMLFYVRDTLGIAGAQTVTGIVIILFTICGALGAALVAVPSDRFDRRAVINASTAVFVGALIGFTVTRNLGVMYALACVAGTGWGGFLASDWALGCSVLPAEMMATAMAVWNLAIAGPQIAAPLLATALVLLVHPQQQTAPLLAFALAVAEVVAGALWVWRVPGLLTETAGN